MLRVFVYSFGLVCQVAIQISVQRLVDCAQFGQDHADADFLGIGITRLADAARDDLAAIVHSGKTAARLRDMIGVGVIVVRFVVFFAGFTVGFLPVFQGDDNGQRRVTKIPRQCVSVFGGECDFFDCHVFLPISLIVDLLDAILLRRLQAFAFCYNNNCIMALQEVFR